MKTKKEMLEKEPVELNEQDEAQEKTPQSKKKRILNTVINVILVIAIVVAVAATYVSFVSTSGNGVPNIFGLQLFSIQTDSMYDTLIPGDLAIGTSIKDISKIEKGDIITYWTIIDGKRVLNTHRVVEIYAGPTEGTRIFQTKGDNNTMEDPMTVHESEVIAKYKFRLPGVGKVFDYLQTSTGFLLVVVVPVFLFFIFHLVQFFRVLFEYQNVKNRLKYEEERGRTEDLLVANAKAEAKMEADRAVMEAELREKLRAEILASMAAEKAAAEEQPEVTADAEAQPEEATEDKPEEQAEEE